MRLARLEPASPSYRCVLSRPVTSGRRSTGKSFARAKQIKIAQGDVNIFSHLTFVLGGLVFDRTYFWRSFLFCSYELE